MFLPTIVSEGETHSTCDSWGLLHLACRARCFPLCVGDDAGHATIDHYAIGTRLQSQFPKPAVKAITYRKPKTIPNPEFRESVRCAVLSQNVDNLVMTFNTDISNFLDKHAPLIHTRQLPGIHTSCERRNKSLDAWKEQCAKKKRIPWFYQLMSRYIRIIANRVNQLLSWAREK